MLFLLFDNSDPKLLKNDPTIHQIRNQSPVHSRILQEQLYSLMYDGVTMYHPVAVHLFRIISPQPLYHSKMSGLKSQPSPALHSFC